MAKKVMLGAIPAMTDVSTSWANYETPGEPPPMDSPSGSGAEIPGGTGMNAGENVGVQTGGKTDVGSGAGTETGTGAETGNGEGGDAVEKNYLPYILLGGLALFFLLKRK